MAPVLRSSAPATPDRAVPSTSPLRRTPCCAICHRPRKGHPRQGCPFADEGDDDETQGVSTTGFNRALSFADKDPAMDTTPVVTSKPKTEYEIRREEGRVMPGTLYPPLDSFLLDPPSPARASSLTPSNSQKTEVADLPSRTEAFSGSMQAPPPSVPARAPGLVRTASMDAREDFLDDITHLSTHFPVSVYTVPADDVFLLMRAARKLGFCAASVAPQDQDRAGAVEALLIIGVSQDAVEGIRAQVTREVRKRPGFAALALVAGGVMAGAVATLAGLSAT